MIIRSQDRTRTTDDLNLHIERRFEERNGEWYEIRTFSHYSIGEYSTMEKAFKVLDLICETYEVFCAGNAYEQSVFNMPQDSEV